MVAGGQTKPPLALENRLPRTLTTRSSWPKNSTGHQAVQPWHVEGNHVPGYSPSNFGLAPMANAFREYMPAAAMAPLVAVTFRKYLRLIFIFHLLDQNGKLPERHAGNSS